MAALPEDEQERWLDRAASEGLSVADLRTELRAAPKPDGDPLDPPALDERDGGEAAVTHEEVTVEDHGTEVLCPQCGYRLAREDLG